MGEGAISISPTIPTLGDRVKLNEGQYVSMLFEKIDKLKVLYRERFDEEVYNPKYNEGASYSDEMKKMRLSVESRNFVDMLLRDVPFEIKSVEMLGSSDSSDARYRVTFRISIWKICKFVDIVKNNAKIYPMISVSDYDTDDGNSCYIQIDLEKCLSGYDKVKYDELEKRYEDVQCELDLLNNDFNKQLRDWKISCTNYDELEEFDYINPLEE